MALECITKMCNQTSQTVSQNVSRVHYLRALLKGVTQMHYMVHLQSLHRPSVSIPLPITILGQGINIFAAVNHILKIA